MTPQTSSTLATWGGTPPIWLAPSICCTIETMCATAAAAAQITPESLFLPSRGPAPVSKTRQVIMAVMRDRLPITLDAIGQIFGGRDHGTVIHACRAIARRRKTDLTLQQIEQSIVLQMTTTHSILELLAVEPSTPEAIAEKLRQPAIVIAAFCVDLEKAGLATSHATGSPESTRKTVTWHITESGKSRAEKLQPSA